MSNVHTKLVILELLAKGIIAGDTKPTTYREGPARPRRYSHNIIEIFTVLNCLCVFYFSLRILITNQLIVACFTVVVLGSKINTASFYSPA